MEILPRHKDVWIGENVRSEIFFAFFFAKNLEKGKCLTYLCIRFWKPHAHHTQTYTMVAKWSRERSDYDSRTDYTDRNAERTASERRILLPDVQRETNCTTVSEPKRARKERRRGWKPTAVYRAVSKEETGMTCRGINKIININFNPSTALELILARLRAQPL